MLVLIHQTSNKLLWPDDYYRSKVETILPGFLSKTPTTATKKKSKNKKEIQFRLASNRLFRQYYRRDKLRPSCFSKFNFSMLIRNFFRFLFVNSFLPVQPTLANLLFLAIVARNHLDTLKVEIDQLRLIFRVFQQSSDSKSSFFALNSVDFVFISRNLASSFQSSHFFNDILDKI